MRTPKKIPSARSLKNLKKPWPKGQSGNPGGRPRKRLIDECLAEILEAADSTEAMALARSWAKEAHKDSNFARLVAERTQGKPRQKVEVTGAEGGPLEAKLTVEFVGAKEKK